LTKCRAHDTCRNLHCICIDDHNIIKLDYSVSIW